MSEAYRQESGYEWSEMMPICFGGSTIPMARPTLHWSFGYKVTNFLQFKSQFILNVPFLSKGGPGGSSTGFGNFQEIGPQDVNLKERKTSWIKYANLLFIDNPVGTGYSYVTNSNAYATNNQQIANDLVELMKNFFKKLPQFQVRW